MFFLITPFWEADRQARISMLNLMHVLLACCSWRTSCVFWLNLAWASVAAYSLEHSKIDVVGSCGSHDQVSSIQSEMWAFLVKLFVHLASKRMLLLDIHREVRAAKSMEEAIETLLHGMCDAVVHLDTDLNLKRGCPQLGVLLLRNSGADCRQNFVDLLKSDDRARFQESIQHPEVDTAPAYANVMHVDMLDAYGTPVHTISHATSYKDTMGNLCHVVGIREWSDWDEIPGILACGNDGDGFAEAARRLRQRDYPEYSHTGQSSTPSDAVPMPLDTEHDDVSVWVQASEAMPMMRCTPGFFDHLGGPSLVHETSLTKWLPRADRHGVIGQVRRVVSVVLHTDQEHTTTLDVILQPPHLPGQFSMSLSMSMQPRTTSAVASAIGEGADDDMDIAIANESMPAVPTESSSSSSSVHPESSVVKLTYTNIRFQRRIQAAGSRMSRRMRPAEDRARASTIGRIQYL